MCNDQLTTWYGKQTSYTQQQYNIAYAYDEEMCNNLLIRLQYYSRKFKHFVSNHSTSIISYFHCKYKKCWLCSRPQQP